MPRIRSGRGPVLALAAMAVAMAGCAIPPTGLIFTHVTQPIDLNLDETPVHNPEAMSDRHTVRYYITVDWGDMGLGGAAKNHGFKRIHYADLETMSVLGIYTRQTAHIYGER